MILILSQVEADITTDEIMDWLDHFGVDFVRLNREDLDAVGSFSIDVSSNIVSTKIAAGGREIDLAEVEAIWFRRWPRERRQANEDYLSPSHSNFKLQSGIRSHLTLELDRLSAFFFSRLSHLPWLSSPSTASVNKLLVLERALEVGLDVPATLVTSRREEVRSMSVTFGDLITKPVGEMRILYDSGNVHFTYTAILDSAAIDNLPESFPLSLFQERLDKEFEVRVFYLDGICYAMAIFSQSDSQTRTDFRHYNFARPNRCVPYQLPQELAIKIAQLMSNLNLETGSLDFIRSPSGQFSFLEVNPVGQFGMVSLPCNYHLEKKVAESLIRRATNGR